MGFTSLVFLVFFPIVYLVYLLMPPKGRAFWLLIASYGFCISFGLKYAVILLISTLGTWLAGIAAEKRQGEAESRWITGAAVLLHVLLLCFFKYNGSHPVLPVGLSFYAGRDAAFAMGPVSETGDSGSGGCCGQCRLRTVRGFRRRGDFTGNPVVCLSALLRLCRIYQYGPRNCRALRN